jgi:hypothetical protein
VVSRACIVQPAASRACAVQRGRIAAVRRVTGHVWHLGSARWPVRALLPLVILAVPCASGAQDASPWFPPFARAPLDTPLVVTSGFGDPRANHFHAGLDFSTDRVVGKPVYAPGNGAIARVRASGQGYGRSIYLQLDDGRLLVYGHLDAFDQPLAAYVDSAQRANARYEMDLLPPLDRFRVTTGQRIAWSGESGAGPPHLHLETRVGDAAYHPLRAGVEVADREPPRIVRVVLEPVAPGARVDGQVMPQTARDGDTIRVVGSFRVRVTAMDDIGARRDFTPWSTRVSLGDREVEARFDSVSWATDMSEVDWLYPTGDAMAMFEPDGYDTRVLRARGWEREIGIFELGTSPSELHVSVRDVAGNAATWSSVVAPEIERAADPAGPVGPGIDPPSGARARLSPVRPGVARVRVEAPRELQSVSVTMGDPATLASRSATSEAQFEDGAWTALVPTTSGPSAIRVHAFSPKGAWTFTDVMFVATVDTAATRGSTYDGDLAWSIPSGSVFEAGFVTFERRPAVATTELRPLSDAFGLLPDTQPLRSAWTLTLRERPAEGVNPFRVGVYRWRGNRWDWIRSVSDATAGTRSAESRRLGRFALFEDVQAPRVRLRGARAGAPGPYSRWALEASVTERGSGIDAIGSKFTVDGVEVPTEWDPDHARLRWRPLTRPAKGAHRYTVRVVDRAGNTVEASGRFSVR